MLDNILFSAVIFAAISTAMMAGIYFAFSGFVMSGLKQVGAENAVSTMNAINQVILRSWFMPLFFGSTLTTVLILIIAMINWQQSNSTLLIFASTIYFLGMFLCTVFFNVPLNKHLLATESSNNTINQTWSHYVKYWTRWNHLRTLTSLFASLCYMYFLHIA